MIITPEFIRGLKRLALGESPEGRKGETALRRCGIFLNPGLKSRVWEVDGVCFVLGGASEIAGLKSGVWETDGVGLSEKGRLRSPD